MRLDQFLKWNDWVSSGGEAKHLIQAGNVMVNGLVEVQRGRKLLIGDRVTYGKKEGLVS